MVARDLMEREVITVHEQDSAADLCDLFQQEHVHGAPVVDEDSRLVGMVSQEDILIGSMAGPTERLKGEQEAQEEKAVADVKKRFPLVRDIMTSPAISAREDTPVKNVCMMMWRLRIHHIPIVDEDKVTGMVSSLDICRAIAYDHILS